MYIQKLRVGSSSLSPTDPCQLIYRGLQMQFLLLAAGSVKDNRLESETMLGIRGVLIAAILLPIDPRGLTSLAIKSSRGSFPDKTPPPL